MSKSVVVDREELQTTFLLKQNVTSQRRLTYKLVAADREDLKCKTIVSGRIKTIVLSSNEF